MHRIELWRKEPRTLLTSFIETDDQRMAGASPLAGLPAGWPEGYEWTRTPIGPCELNACTWDADWRPGLRGRRDDQGTDT